MSPSSSRCSSRSPERSRSGHRWSLYQVFGLLAIVCPASKAASFLVEQWFDRPSAADHPSIWLDHWVLSGLLPELLSISSAEDYLGQMKHPDSNQLQWMDAYLGAHSSYQYRIHCQNLLQLLLLGCYSVPWLSCDQAGDLAPSTARIFPVIDPADSAQSSWLLYSQIC